MGQAIRELHLKSASAARSGLRFLDAGTEAGAAYLSDLDWALAYAEENRRALVLAAAAVMEEAFGVKADLGSAFACQHNQVRRETHSGEDLWVHRKGAISALAGEPGSSPAPWAPPASTWREGAASARSPRAPTAPAAP
jgi:tRNA-splicing ligase RtcB